MVRRHLDTNGPGPAAGLKALPTYIDAPGKVAAGAKQKVVVFEHNSGNHAMRRVLGHPLATNRIERDGRVPIATSANGLRPDKQNDGGEGHRARAPAGRRPALQCQVTGAFGTRRLTCPRRAATV